MLGKDFKIDIEKKEKKLSWSIVFAWLYLHTFGKILPKKWNKWAKNIIDPYEVTNSNEITKSRDNKDVSSSAKLQTESSVSLDTESQTENNVDDGYDLGPQTESSARLDSKLQMKDKVDDGYDSGSQCDISDCGSKRSEDSDGLESLKYDDEYYCRAIEEAGDRNDKELNVLIDALEAGLTELNKKDLQRTIRGLEQINIWQAETIKLLERALETSVASETAQKSKALRAENEQLKQTLNKIPKHTFPNTSMTCINPINGQERLI